MQIGARSTGSLVKISVLTGGTGYAVPPTVVIAGGTGVTAHAHLDNGRISSVAIRSGGSGFTSSPTISFSVASQAVTISSFTAGTTSGTITFASTVASTHARITAGTFANTITEFANATQAVIATTSFASSGAATVFAGGTGAAATAFAYTGSLRPATFFKGRFNDMYGVDGMGRGFRWNGTDASVEPIGLQKPAVGPAVTASSSSSGGYLSAVQMVLGGAGYFGQPSVVISGGTPTTQATARAVVANGRVSRVIVTNRGAGYVTNPTIAFTGGIGVAASFTVACLGRVSEVAVVASGRGYTTASTCTGVSSSGVFTSPRHGLLAGSTFSFSSLGASTAGVTVDVEYYAVTVGGNTFTAATTTGGSTNILTANLPQSSIRIPPPRIAFATTGGLTDVLASVSVDSDGGIQSVGVLSEGTGLTAATVSATVTGGAGSGALVTVKPVFEVSGVTVASSGSGYYTAPVLTFRASPSDPTGSGAAATVNINTSGNISGVSMVSGGRYASHPTALVLNTAAKAQATIAQPLQGKYQCAIRYLDDTPDTAQGPIPSSISELVEIDVLNPSDSLTWTLSHYGLDDRVAAVELWRSSADQSVALYRIATFKRTDPEFSGTYVDSFSDPGLQDTKRDGFGVMPVVLPSGQINARRFGVIPGDFAVAAMFQDRAWFAVDTSGDRPNSLLYSEIDEPESVPAENELILQENTQEPDRVVGLVPLGSQLLIAQSTHLYALTYVSQPVIDASMMLVAYRGLLSQACSDVLNGVAVMVDTYGMYAFDGNNAEAISVPVDDYWRNGVIDFSKSDKFHVRCDPSTMTARFFYCKSADSAPTRALCYCFNTKAWWEETYAQPITASCNSSVAAKAVIMLATNSGSFLKSSGLTDSGTPVPYSIRTGNLPLSNEPNRAISLLYKPTATTETANIGLHYNNSSTARPNAIAHNPGSGFVAGTTSSSLDMSKNRSALQEANGYAQANYSGRLDDKSSGGDRHIAVALSGDQSGDAVAFYAMNIQGAG
jgi:hypothetical protein